MLGFHSWTICHIIKTHHRIMSTNYCSNRDEIHHFLITGGAVVSTRKAQCTHNYWGEIIKKFGSLECYSIKHFCQVFFASLGNTRMQKIYKIFYLHNCHFFEIIFKFDFFFSKLPNFYFFSSQIFRVLAGHSSSM